MSTVRVVNKRRWGRQPEPGETVIAVDKSNPVLGNFHVKHTPRDPEERAAVIAAYRRDLEADLAIKGPKYQAIQAIAQRVAGGECVALACWCAPLPCHADLIADAVESMLKDGPVIQNSKG